MTKPHSAFSGSCLNCGLQKVCFPTGLMKTDIDQLDDIVERRAPLKKSQHLYQVGDKFNAIYAIRSGVLKMYAYSDSGEEIVHGFFLPGDVVGFDGMLDQQYQFNMIALDSTSVCHLPYDKLTELSQQIPSLNQQIIAVMGKKLQFNRLHSELLIKRNADQRVAHFIWHMADRFKQRGYIHEEFRLNILHRDVALYLGLTPETVSRILSKFNSDKVVSWKKKQVVIFDEGKLKQLAGFNNNELCEEFA